MRKISAVSMDIHAVAFVQNANIVVQVKTVTAVSQFPVAVNNLILNKYSRIINKCCQEILHQGCQSNGKICKNFSLIELNFKICSRRIK